MTFGETDGMMNGQSDSYNTYHPLVEWGYNEKKIQKKAFQLLNK